jgi:hypothetical protein
MALCHPFLYKYLTLCFNSSVLNWTKVCHLNEKPNGTKLFGKEKQCFIVQVPDIKLIRTDPIL